MAESSNQYKFARLTGDNYHAWAIRTKSALIEKGLYEAVDPGYGSVMNANETKVNDKALAFIHRCVEDSYFYDIGHCQTAKEAWEILEELHTKYGILHILQLLRELFNIRMQKGETMREYIARILDLHIKLDKCGHGFKDREVALIILLGLPEGYEQLILSLEHQEESITTKEVKAKLLLEEKRKSSRETTTKEEDGSFKALAVREFNTGGRQNVKPQQYANTSGKYNRKQKRKCFSCGRMGYHLAKDCWQRNTNENSGDGVQQNKEENMAKKASEVTVHRALRVANGDSRETNVWYLDSAATEHMTSTREKLANLHHVTSTVEVANNEKLQVNEAGDAILNVSNVNGGQTITLKDVLYVPGLDCNLLSMGRIEEMGFSVHLSGGEATVLDNDGKMVITAKRVGRMYPIYETEHFARLSKTSIENIWHQRLGHLHSRAVSQMIQSNLSETGKGDNEENEYGTKEKCEVCMIGKMKRQPFPREGSQKSATLLQLVHSDVVGPIKPMSKGGASYIALFTDDHSGYSKIYFMKKKSETLENFIKYKNDVENELDLKIKILRSDNGGEYCSEAFQEYLAKAGIKHQLSVPRNPEQNGVSERKNQTILDTTRCLLIQSGLPKTFWADAANTACFIRNKCTSRAINGKTPEELWTGKPVKLDRLKVFGCRVWSHIDKAQRETKLDPRGVKCVLIGFPEDIKGYKLWNPENDKVFVSRNVIFEEQVFPCKKITNENLNGTQDELENQVTLFENDEPEADGHHKTIVTSENEIQPELEVENITQIVQCHESEQPEKQKLQVEEDVPQARQSTRSRRKRQCQTCCKAEQTEPRPPEPKTLKEALSGDEKEQWIAAIEEELKCLEENKTWKIVPRPEEKNVIDTKWVFKRKYDEFGKIEKYRARLVARGFNQIHGVDYDETFSPVIKHKSIRALLALAVECGWEAYHLDVASAYLNGELTEDVFMEIPEKLNYSTNYGKYVCKLNKGIYGLRQSGKAWNEKIDKFLHECELKRSLADPCIYYKDDLIVGMYVDDLLVITINDEVYERFKNTIQVKFKCRDLGKAKHLLAMKITRVSKDEISLDQKTYIDEMLLEYKMSNAKPASTPLPPGTRYNRASPDDIVSTAPYRQAVGGLLYLANMTRPDLAHVAAYMGQFSNCPTDEHWNGIKHILRYIKGTRELTITYHKTGKQLQAFTDADWGSDIVDRRSFSGYVYTLADGAISWGSRKQRVTATSTVEAEYLAMCEAAKEGIWLTSLLQELGMHRFVDLPILILADNQGAMCLAKSQVVSERSKHIDLKWFFLRELVDGKKVAFCYVPSEDNPADMMTKVLNSRVTSKFCEKIGLKPREEVNISGPSETYMN